MSAEDSYRYHCEDRSVLLPYYKKYLWLPALSLVPATVSPNSLSLLGNLGSLVSFVALLLVEPGQNLWFLVPAAGTFAYLCFDNMDGTHARRTQQSSPLGEFLDHWFDSFNTGFLTLGLYYAGGLDPAVVLGIVAATNVAFCATMWEQRHTSIIRLGRGGQIEGVTGVVLVYLAVAILGYDAICTYRIFGLLSVIELTAVVLVMGYVVTVAACAWRTRRAFGEWLPLLFVMAVLITWFMVGKLGFFPAAFALMLVNAALGGRHVIARVLGRPYNPMDLGLVVLALAGFGASWLLDLTAGVQSLLGWGVSAYLGARLVYDFLSTVHALRRFVRPGEFLERALLLRNRSGRVS